MGSTKKLLDKMRHNPHDWRMESLESIANYYGVNIRKSGGSHVVFDHVEWIELLCVPARRPIKPIYIKKFVNLIDFLKEKDNE